MFLTDSHFGLCSKYVFKICVNLSLNVLVKKVLIITKMSVPKHGKAKLVVGETVGTLTVYVRA